MTTQEKCHAVFGVALQKILRPELLQFVEPVITHLYNDLNQQYNIQQQSYPNHLPKYPPSSAYNLAYRNINSNHRFDSDSDSPEDQYDYCIRSAIDLAKLYLPATGTNMAELQAFVDFDAYKLLTLIINIKVNRFGKDVRTPAWKVREHRNKWAHTSSNLEYWTEENFKAAFSDMKSLMATMYGPTAVPDELNTQLHEWEALGNLTVTSRYCGLYDQLILCVCSNFEFDL